MVQHVLLILVAAPLIALRRAGDARSSASPRPDIRRRCLLPILHSRRRCACSPTRSSPGSLFAAVMWGTHFSPLFDAALENPWSTTSSTSCSS